MNGFIKSRKRSFDFCLKDSAFRAVKKDKKFLTRFVKGVPFSWKMVYHKGKGLDLTGIRICWVPHGDHAANFCGPEITVTGKFNWEAKSIFVCLLSHLWDLGQWPWTFYNMHYRAYSLTWTASVLIYTNIESFYIRQEFNKPLLVCCAFPIAGPRRTWPIVFS